MTVLEFRDVHRSFHPGTEVLSGVTLSVAEGQVVGLVGRNGSGKTTLINIAMGMLRAHGGEVRVFGMDPQVNPVEIKSRIGFVSEDQVLPPAMRVDSVVQFHRELFRSWDTDLERALRERFSFDGRARVHTLSKGQARQLALLCAVAHKPDLLILDEPAGSLDPAARRELLGTSVQLLSEAGTTILFSSHQMGDVERMADRIVLLEDRRVMIDAPLEKLREAHAVALVRARDVESARLAALPDCLRVRSHGGTLHAVFRGRAEEVASRLQTELGVTESRCAHVPLEELFVELVGRNT